MLKSGTSQGKCYTHLSLKEREEIAVALEQGQSIRFITESPGRSPSSISREIKRNSPPLNKVAYRGNRAQRRAKEQLANPLVKAYVEGHLIHDGWTTQSIANRLPLDFPGLTSNYESIVPAVYDIRRIARFSYCGFALPHLNTCYIKT